jgi:CBS domain-containing protein
MLRLRHLRADRTAADRRLRRSAISSIIRILRHKPAKLALSALAEGACNEIGAELLIEDSSEQRPRSPNDAVDFREATMTVRAILDSKGHQIQSVEPEAKLATAIKILGERKIGAVLVMDKGHIEGILSERDIVRVLGERGAAVLDESVSAVMTRKVISCKESDTVSAIMEMMTTGKFRHLPVVEDGRVVGLISIGDIVKWRVREYELEQEALRDYIKTA